MYKKIKWTNDVTNDLTAKRNAIDNGIRRWLMVIKESVKALGALMLHKLECG